MSAYRKVVIRLMLLALLVCSGTLLVLLAGQTASPTQASSLALGPKKRTPTPTRAPTPTNTPTPAPPACWSVVQAPTVPGYGAALRAVAGSNDNDLWAVGWFLENNSRHNLTLHWNGSVWERVPVPDVVNIGDNSVN